MYHMTDHALITWLSCTEYVAEHALFTWLITHLSRDITYSRDKRESALARPSVLRDGKTYRMWYSYKDAGADYTIGYAESPDGLTWTRLDHAAGISRSAEGWDSEMIEYGFVFAH